jgi:hypothetical protein
MDHHTDAVDVWFTRTYRATCGLNLIVETPSVPGRLATLVQVVPFVETETSALRGWSPAKSVLSMESRLKRVLAVRSSWIH